MEGYGTWELATRDSTLFKAQQTQFDTAIRNLVDDGDGVTEHVYHYRNEFHKYDIILLSSVHVCMCTFGTYIIFYAKYAWLEQHSSSALEIHSFPLYHHPNLKSILACRLEKDEAVRVSNLILLEELAAFHGRHIHS